MLLNLPEGAVEIPVPERFKNLISDNYCVEAVQLKDEQIEQLA